MKAYKSTILNMKKNEIFSGDFEENQPQSFG